MAERGTSAETVERLARETLAKFSDRDGHTDAAAQLRSPAALSVDDGSRTCVDAMIEFGALSAPSPASAEAMRETIRTALYEGLGWFGTLPEPEGDVPERYHRWEDLGEFADRIIAALAPKPDEVTVPEGMKPWHGGDSAPEDAPEIVTILTRGGTLSSMKKNAVHWRYGTFIHEIGEPMPPDCDIIAYTPKPAPDRLTEGELLRCPFCGGEASKDDIGSMKALYSVGCNNNDCPVECFVTSITGYEEPIAAWNQRATTDARLRAENERLVEALTASNETKYAYMGEFSWTEWLPDENGIEQGHERKVPWSTIKEIMAAIRGRAALGGETRS